ncbi:hypothetical protein AgCh_017043 [Apium graveolens]
MAGGLNPSSQPCPYSQPENNDFQFHGKTLLFAVLKALAFLVFIMLFMLFSVSRARATAMEEDDARDLTHMQLPVVFYGALKKEETRWSGLRIRMDFGVLGSRKLIHYPVRFLGGFLFDQDPGRIRPLIALVERISRRRGSSRNPAAKEINEDNVPLVEETARMKKARLAGLDTRGKATEPIFLRKHKEPMGEASTEGAEGHSA